MRPEHAPHNAMRDPGEIAAFYDGCSDLMRELLDALAAAPDEPRPFGDIEDAMGWPRRRIASVLGGVFHLRTTRFGGRRPYRFHDAHWSGSGRWELWMDADQAAAIVAPANGEWTNVSLPSGGSAATFQPCRRPPSSSSSPPESARTSS